MIGKTKTSHTILTLSLVILISGGLSACSALNEPNLQKSDINMPPLSQAPYHGWAYLVDKLTTMGISRQKLERVFQDSRMPEFSLITFKLKPVESSDIYAKFRSAQKIATGQSFIRDYQYILSQMEARWGVEKEIVTAILLVETHFGQNTGKELVLNRLARVSSVAEPETLSKNYLRLKLEDSSITFEQVKARAMYLEQTFLPELAALFTLCEREKIDIFDLKGSIAGAFGIPQFLPKSYLSFAVDGNNDGSISLFDLNDAAFSTASFLKNYGWKSILNEEKKRAVVWNYNHSTAYVDTIFWLATGMKYQKRGV